MFVLYLLGFLLWRPWRQQCTGSLKRRHSAFVSVWSGPWPLEGSVAKCCELHRIGKLVSHDLDSFFFFTPCSLLMLRRILHRAPLIPQGTTVWYVITQQRKSRPFLSLQTIFPFSLQSQNLAWVFFILNPVFSSIWFWKQPWINLLMTKIVRMSQPHLSQIQVDHKLFYCLDIELISCLVSCWTGILDSTLFPSVAEWTSVRSSEVPGRPRWTF